MGDKGKTVGGFGRYWDWESIKADELLLAVTVPYKGNDILNDDWADTKCQESFGPDWIWVDYTIYVGHKPLLARMIGSIDNYDKAWVQAYGQNWECYEKGVNDYPDVKWQASNKPVNYPDTYAGGMVSFINKTEAGDYYNVTWWGDPLPPTGMIGSNYALCSDSLPILCAMSSRPEFYTERQTRKQAVIDFRATRDAN